MGFEIAVLLIAIKKSVTLFSEKVTEPNSARIRKCAYEEKGRVTS